MSLNEPMGLQNTPADARAFSLPQFKKRPWDRGCSVTHSFIEASFSKASAEERCSGQNHRSRKKNRGGIVR